VAIEASVAAGFRLRLFWWLSDTLSQLPRC
jgi:hypothetical protein